MNVQEESAALQTAVQQTPVDRLVEALQLQTLAISRLAASNEALVQAMIDSEGDADTDRVPTVGLNGRPL